MNQLQMIESMLEDSGYSCIPSELTDGTESIYCFDADKHFLTVEDALDWLNEEE